MNAQLFVTRARMEDSHWWFLARRRILGETRWNARLNRPGRVLHLVGRTGTALLYVVEIRPYIPK